ncbi:HD domain-containing protein [Candidatus Providencia siddallii]|uniref:GTP pyrophosphokinase, partial n=1 Tax=Candidatus Providencia siddallii TaxID=1715285 RepID=A0ABP1CDF1_9GAMM
MVAIRNIHFTLIDNFSIENWIDSLVVDKPQLKKKIISIWRYCYDKLSDQKLRYILLLRSIEIIEILLILNMDFVSFQTAMLLQLVVVKKIEKQEIIDIFGISVYNLMKCVLDINIFYQVNLINYNKINFEINKTLSIVKDTRCIIIKLAERIACLREIKYAIESKKISIAKECFYFYAPLANRLGIEQLKWELEDLCFCYLYKKEYRKISKFINERRIDREKYISDFIVIVNNYITERHIKAEIYGRPKHIYSIWRKMQKKSLSFNKLFDLLAIRIIVNCLRDCYLVLDIIHSHFYHIYEQFDDYILTPKSNGYQSIHTVVFGPKDRILEIQIRTKKMHKNAKLGIAAHWKYKE